MELSTRQISQLIKTLLFVGAAEILIGFAQFASRGRLYSFFAPRQSDIGVLGETRSFILISRGRELGSIFGTLGDTLYFGLFMLIILAIYLSRIKKFTLWNLSGIGVILLAIGLSYSRASFLGAILLLFVWYIRFHKPRTSQVVIAGTGLVIVLIAVTLSNVFSSSQEYVNPRFKQQNIVKNVLSAFTSEYVSSAQSNRLGMIIWVPPVVAKEAFWFGYSPDQATAIDQLNKTDIPHNYKLLKDSGFEDVYWAAIFAYYGIVGLSAFVMIFAKGLLAAWNAFQTTKSALTREISIAVFCTWIIAPFLLFFYRALEFRAYSFFLWLLPALMINLLVQEKRQELNLNTGAQSAGIS
jgi:hypothetical protein